MVPVPPLLTFLLIVVSAQDVVVLLHKSAETPGAQSRSEWAAA